MKRHSAIVLAVTASAALLMGPMCEPLPGPNESDGGGGGVVFQPLDETKAIASCATNPSLLVSSAGSVAVTAQAIVLFNSTLIASSVNIHDVTDGTPVLLGSLAPAGIAEGGQKFSGVVEVDASSIGTLTLRCSAAYRGDPRRATRTTSLQIVSSPVVPAFVVANVVQSPIGEHVVNQIVAILARSAGEAEAEDLADEIGATIEGFDPVTNTYVYELPFGPSDPGALEALNAAIAALLAQGDLVIDAFPNVTVGVEAIDYDSLAAGQAPFAAANLPDAWAQFPDALTASGLANAETVKIAVLGQGIEAGNFNPVTPVAPHPELNYGCASAGILATCPLVVPDANDQGDLDILLGGVNGTHNASCNATCEASRRKVDHGTLMAGIIGAVNNDGKGSPAGTNGILAFADGATGNAPATPSLLGGANTGSDVPFQILYSNQALAYGQLPSVITDLEGDGAQVILLSLGWTVDTVDNAICDLNSSGVPVEPRDIRHSAATITSISNAFRTMIAAHPNLLFVASAGNCGTDASNHTPGGMSLPPANLIVVGATDSSGNAAGFSNTGAAIDVAAPGVGVPGPVGYHDLGVVNAQAAVGSASGASFPDIETGSGTSVSAAMAAGVAGLYLAVTGPLDDEGVEGLATAMTLSNAAVGTGLAGVPRLDALAVVQATLRTKTDLALVLDTSGSFGTDIEIFQDQAPSLLNRLSNLGLDVAVTVSEFQDFPGFGGLSTDVPFARLAIPDFGSNDEPTPLNEPSGSSTVSNITAIGTALATLDAPSGAGGDGPESQLEALMEIATGVGNGSFVAAGQGGVAGDPGVVTPALRADSDNRFAILWTDAEFHVPGRAGTAPGYPGPTFAQVCDALNARGIKVISILGAAGIALDADVVALADCTNSCVPAGVSVDCDNDGTADLAATEPFICQIDADGEGIADAIQATVAAAASGPITCP
jgi:hypothetical protein